MQVPKVLLFELFDLFTPQMFQSEPILLELAERIGYLREMK